MTIADLIKAASEQLAALSDSASLDAKVLLAHALNKDTTYLITWSDKALSDAQINDFDKLLSRRLSGEPVAYIVGTREFWSLPFFVAPSTLIPRPDTETLVDLVLSHFPHTNLSLLDLGTGTGAIALALASEQSEWNIQAVDFNEDAVALAKKNAENLDLNHVNIYQSDWFGSVKGDASFDVIVSNPPYIDSEDHHLDEGDVRFEPKSALVAAQQGLADIQHICTEATRYLAPNGRIYIEHGFEQGAVVRDIMQQAGFEQCTTVQDLGGNDRITWAILT